MFKTNVRFKDRELSVWINVEFGLDLDEDTPCKYCGKPGCPPEISFGDIDCNGMRITPKSSMYKNTVKELRNAISEVGTVCHKELCWERYLNERERLLVDYE